MTSFVFQEFAESEEQSIGILETEQSLPEEEKLKSERLSKELNDLKGDNFEKKAKFIILI